MTLEEAEKLAEIFAGVDNGCSTCVEAVCREANEGGFGFYWEPRDFYTNDFRVLVVSEKPDLSTF